MEVNQRANGTRIATFAPWRVPAIMLALLVCLTLVAVLAFLWLLVVVPWLPWSLIGQDSLSHQPNQPDAGRGSPSGQG